MTDEQLEIILERLDNLESMLLEGVTKSSNKVNRQYTFLFTSILGFLAIIVLSLIPSRIVYGTYTYETGGVFTAEFLAVAKDIIILMSGGTLAATIMTNAKKT